MPIHDWTRVEAGIFHHFHHRWISAVSDALNAGLLPDEYYALAEQDVGRFGPDVLIVQRNALSCFPQWLPTEPLAPSQPPCVGVALPRPPIPLLSPSGDIQVAL